MRVVTSEQMKRIEENSLSHGLTFHRLMENAGGAAASFIRRTFSVEGRNCMVFCSRGNNGGDGLVVGRKLAEEGANVVLVLLDGAPKSEEALDMYNTAIQMELPMVDFGEERDKALGFLEQTDIIVDAICGTGFGGGLREHHRAACQAINAAIAAVVSLDLPTGVTCDSGEVDPDAVRADFTLVFDSRKPAHILPASQSHCGVVEVLDIGIPEEAHENIDSLFGSLDTREIFTYLPPRAPDSHKGDYGRLLNISGSLQYRGAATLSTLGALRSGVGLLTLASTEAVCAATAAHLPEAIYLPLPVTAVGGVDADASVPLLATAQKKADAVLFGCGLGNTVHTAQLLLFLLETAGCPIVIDADGINALAQNIHVLNKASAPVILTPHPGEMARLCGVSVQQISADRQGHAMQFARDHGVTVVLKGSGTLIASPDGGLQLNRSGNPGLAKGGSGDILAGMIGAFLAQGLSPSRAAACGVHLHGLAADRTAARRSQAAMLPSELLEDLAAIFCEHGR